MKEPVPTRVEATLSQRLFVRKAGLPSSLINALRRIAAFQNPDFYQKQRLRLYDYVDRRVPVLARMYKRRLTGYRAIGYERSEETML